MKKQIFIIAFILSFFVGLNMAQASNTPKDVASAFLAKGYEFSQQQSNESLIEFADFFSNQATPEQKRAALLYFLMNKSEGEMVISKEIVRKNRAIVVAQYISDQGTDQIKLTLKADKEMMWEVVSMDVD